MPVSFRNSQFPPRRCVFDDDIRDADLFEALIALRLQPVILLLATRNTSRYFPQCAHMKMRHIPQSPTVMIVVTSRSLVIK